MQGARAQHASPRGANFDFSTALPPEYVEYYRIQQHTYNKKPPTTPPGLMSKARLLRVRSSIAVMLYSRCGVTDVLKTGTIQGGGCYLV